MNKGERSHDRRIELSRWLTQVSR